MPPRRLARPDLPLGGSLACGLASSTPLWALTLDSGAAPSSVCPTREEDWSGGDGKAEAEHTLQRMQAPGQTKYVMGLWASVWPQS